MKEKVYFYPSPFGEMGLRTSPKGITRLWFGHQPENQAGAVEEETPLHKEAAAQLAQYFDGQRQTFTLPLDLRGTDFQQKVWQALLTIPYGETRSYKDIAQQVGSPRGYRPVGSANGRNPVPVICPCHRVVASPPGGLGGYAYGLDMKKQLLDIEGK